MKSFVTRALLLSIVLLPLASPGSASVVYQTSSDWGSGFNGQITITNDTGAVINNWTLEFDFSPTINLMWNANVASQTGSHYVVSPASWDVQIPVGGTVSIGFGGAPGNITAGPQNFKLNGVTPPPAPPAPPVTPPTPPTPPAPPPVLPPPPVALPTGVAVSFVQTGQWQGGFGANIVITNNTGAAVTQWTLGFNLVPTISSLWNGNLTTAGALNTVTNLDWNASIPNGTSISLGFNGNGTLNASAISNCIFNGSPCTLSYSSSAPAPVVTQSIVLTGIDGTAPGATPAYYFAIPQGTSSFPISLLSPGISNFSVVVSNPSVVSAQILQNNTLQVTGLTGGRSSLQLQDSVTGTIRYVGVRVRNADGTLPGLPKYLSVGSVSEDTSDDLSFWESFQPGAMNKRMDVRYIYLNGGPVNGWDTWGNQPGDRATNYIRNSHMLGMIPFFVFYNIADGGESYYTDTAHVQDPTYMAGYFQNLKLALDIINQESPDDMVGMVLEPDFLGYLAQIANAPASAILAMTSSAYSSGVLTSGVDPAFPNTVQGLVKAINYTISKYAPQVYFGWQMNLWASPAGGWTTSVPGTGLMHKTETAGITAGRQLIAGEAAAITQYYLNAGIATYGAKFVSIDKYGFDATGAEASAATNPAGSIWFWNDDLWNNYLVFVKTMKTTTGLPVVLWQLPVGHINGTTLNDPYSTQQVFPDLTNQDRQLQDSAPDFFLGDTFVTSGAPFNYFSQDLGSDPKVTVNGQSITWGSHMADAAAAGVVSVLFGAGVGGSTNGIGMPPTDSYWWITNVQHYFANPVPLP